MNRTKMAPPPPLQRTRPLAEINVNCLLSVCAAVHKYNHHNRGAEMGQPGQLNLPGIIFIASVVFFIGVLARSLFGGKASSEDLLKTGAFLGAAMVALVFGLAIHSHLDEIKHSFTTITWGENMDGLLGFLFFVVLPGWWIYARFFKDRTKVKTHYQQAEDGPMQVKITVEPITRNTPILNFVRGRPLSHALVVDVKISKKDWAAIKKAGLYDALLFQYPDTTSTYSGEMMDYRVSSLTFKGSAGFYNIGQAEEAKQTLIQNLHNLKAAIVNEGRQEYSFEI
jgi:hypothetical protein